MNGSTLILIDKVSDNQQAFAQKVQAIAARRLFDANWLMAAMAVETGFTFSPSIVNGIGATGLIQFTRSTAAGLGTTTDALAAMSNVEQLDYVDQYLTNVMRERNVIFKSYLDLYLAIFYPAFIGKPLTSQLPAGDYASNKGIDLNKDGVITVDDINAWFLSKFDSVIQNILKKK